MATLKEWNDGIAWYFIDRPEAEGKRSRISLTEARVKQIAEYLKEHLNLPVSGNPVKDLLQSVFDKAGHDENYGGSTSILECASRLFYNADTLAYRYDKWRENGGPSGEDYPDLIPHS